MERRQLGNTDVRLSVLGFGASPLGGVFGDVTQASADEAVRTAIDVRFPFFIVSIPPSDDATTV